MDEGGKKKFLGKHGRAEKITEEKRYQEIVQELQIPILERIKLPQVWTRLPPDIVVVDLLEDNYKRLVEFIKTEFIHVEPMCHALGVVNDPEAFAEIVAYYTRIMKDQVSLIALSTTNNNILGFLLARVMDRTSLGQTMSRMRIDSTEKMQKMSALRSYLNTTANVYETYDCNTYYKIYECFVPLAYRGYGVTNGLVRSAIQLAFKLKQPVVVGLFSAMSVQRMALSYGFRKVVEVFFTKWVTKDDKKVIFDDTGEGYYTYALMGGVLTVLSKFTLQQPKDYVRPTHLRPKKKKKPG